MKAENYYSILKNLNDAGINTTVDAFPFFNFVEKPKDLPEGQLKIDIMSGILNHMCNNKHITWDLDDVISQIDRDKDNSWNQSYRVSASITIEGFKFYQDHVNSKTSRILSYVAISVSVLSLLVSLFSLLFSR
jgi:hypothetical protein